MSSGIGSSQNDYSIGVLIVLLLAFWYMCRSSVGSCGRTPSAHTHSCSCTECMNGSLTYPAPAMSDRRAVVTRANYGNTPTRIGSSAGVKYIRTVDSGNKKAPLDVEIPNSKTAMRRLFDEPQVNAGPVSRHEAMSASFADMHINKQTLQTARNNPSSMTSSRGMVHASQ